MLKAKCTQYNLVTAMVDVTKRKEERKIRYYTINGAHLSSWTTLFLISCEIIAGRDLTDEETGLLVDAALEHISEDDLETFIAEECVRKISGPQS